MNKKERVGETKIMKNGMNATIIEYRSNKDLDIKFEDGFVRKHVQYHSFF